MYDGFFIKEKNDIPLDVQKERQELTAIRLGKVSSILTESSPSILPFKGSFPLIGKNSLRNYMDEYNEEMMFRDLSRFLKHIVYKAEQIVYYTDLFETFLESKEIGKKSFNAEDPKTKLKILNDFLDEQQTSISILEIKDYE